MNADFLHYQDGTSAVSTLLAGVPRRYCRPKGFLASLGMLTGHRRIDRPLDFLHALDIAHAGDLFKPTQDPLQVLYVLNVDHDVDGRLIIGGA